ncbi:SseB family protein [Streptomyces sp. NPDC093149]|uniref:SseB family protein n=1 Tax=Streptomyces sp. NPDC093149 TaxID=3366031 RepID=UPI00381A6856
MEQAREAVRERLADFRSRVVLVPLEEQDGLWTAEFGGLDWICAFSDEEALARFAAARGEEGREWSYRRVVGARLLDEVVPVLDFPCGVALNAAGPDGAVFPPVRGIVPDAAALDGEAA